MNTADVANLSVLPRRLTGHLLRDITVSLVTTLTATAIWAAMPAHQEKAAIRAEPVPVSTMASAADIAIAAQLEQIALSKLAPLRTEAELLQPSVGSASALASKPLHKIIRQQEIIRQQASALPLPPVRPVNLAVAKAEPSTAYTARVYAAPIYAATQQERPAPSMFSRIVDHIPGRDLLDAGVGLTAEYVGWAIPNFR